MAQTSIPVIILAGGKSTRLGRDKASEVLAGKTLLQHAIDACSSEASCYVVVKAAGQQLPDGKAKAEITVLEDVYPETGPLGGIYTGLHALASGAAMAERALVVACDMPLLQPALLRELVRLAPGHDACVPELGGQPEPLCAVYGVTCLEPARRLLENGAYKVAGLIEAVDALLIPEQQWRRFDPRGLSFRNVNREQDLADARAILDAGGARH